MTPRIVILTRQTYRDIPHKDDALLKERLLHLGCKADIIAWDDPVYPFDKADVAIVRSCWDFHWRTDEYLQRIAEIAARTCLLNPFEDIKKYSNKHYLHDLHDFGINIVPAAFCRSIQDAQKAAQDFGSQQVVIKPVVSASGRNTFLVNRHDRPALENAAAQVFKIKDELLVQPFIKSVQTRGERSTVVIQGEPLFTMQKLPAKDNFLAHEHHGGTFSQTEIDQSAHDFLAQICATFKTPPLYMRVDYLEGPDGVPMLLELELNEPNLYLSKSERILEALSTRLAEIGHREMQNRRSK